MNRIRIISWIFSIILNLSEVAIAEHLHSELVDQTDCGRELDSGCFDIRYHVEAAAVAVVALLECSCFDVVELAVVEMAPLTVLSVPTVYVLTVDSMSAECHLVVAAFPADSKVSSLAASIFFEYRHLAWPRMMMMTLGRLFSSPRHYWVSRNQYFVATAAGASSELSFVAAVAAECLT